MNLCNFLRNSRLFSFSVRSISTQKIQSTYVFRHIHQPERTPDGMHQRKPSEKQEFEKYEVIENQDEIPIGPLKVILLEDIEGIGLQFDVVDVDRTLARNNLILLRRAAYASPFDLDYYAKKKEVKFFPKNLSGAFESFTDYTKYLQAMKEELESRIRIPYDSLKLGRVLLAKVVPILVSMQNPWKVDKHLIWLSLIQAGIDTVPKYVHLPEMDISGPNLDMEAKLIRFYIAINGQYIIPMLGRLQHISSDDSKESLYPEHSNLPSDDYLRKSGLRPETPYFFPKPVDESFDVVEFMRNRK